MFYLLGCGRRTGIPELELRFGFHPMEGPPIIPYGEKRLRWGGDNRSRWIPKGSEIPRLYAYLRPAPGTIPEMRLDLLGLRSHRCNKLEIVKGGFHFRTPEPRKSTTD